jgi:hypothetical protein
MNLPSADADESFGRNHETVLWMDVRDIVDPCVEVLRVDYTPGEVEEMTITAATRLGADEIVAQVGRGRLTPE